jgi:hypothetical protein
VPRARVSGVLDGALDLASPRGERLRVGVVVKVCQQFEENDLGSGLGCPGD